MAARYWVGASGTVWNATVGTKWATTSGGAGGASVPTAADDVFFDANSTGNATTSGTLACRSLNFTGYTKTFTMASGVTINVGDATAGSGNVAIAASSSMAWVLSGGVINLISTSSTQQTITSAGKIWPPTTINGTGSNYALADAGLFNTFTVTAGSFATNNYNLTFTNNGFSSNNNNVRSLNFGTSLVTLNQSSWNIGGSNLTSAFGSATFSLNWLGASTIALGGLSYGPTTIGFINFGSADQSVTITGSNTFSSLTLDWDSGPMSNLGTFILTAGTTQTVLGAFTITGVSGNVIKVRSSSAGTRYTINCAAVGNNAHSYADVQDMALTGEAKHFMTNGVDSGNNAEIRFNAVTTGRQSLLGCGI